MDVTTLGAILLAAFGAGWLSRTALMQRGVNVAGAFVRTIERHADALVNVSIGLYIALWGALAWLKYWSLNLAGFDLGIFDQVVWNSLRGRLFENTLLPDAPVLIGQRFSPILIAFVPLYAVWASPLVLISVQTIALGIAALPIYWTARARLGRWLGVVIVATYLLFPTTQYMGLFEFHESPLAVPLLAFATFFLLRRKYLPLGICLGLALLVKEEIAFIVCTFGLYIFLVQRRWWLGAGLAVFGVLWAALLLQIILPFFRGTEGYYYFSHGALGGAFDRYGYLGTSLFEIIATILTRPVYVLQHVLILPKFEFVLLLLVPLALIPLLSPELLLLALPTFAISLLSDLNLIYSIRYHYTAGLVPFLFFAAIVGVERLSRWRKFSRFSITVLLLAASGLSYYFQSPGPLAREFKPAQFTLSAHAATGHALAQAIPDDAIVVVQTGLIPYLTHRRSLFEFPNIPFLWQSEYLLADTTSEWYQRFASVWDKWFESGYFQIVRQVDGFILAQRRALPQSPQIKLTDAIRLNRIAIVSPQPIHGGESIMLPIEWLALRDIHTRYIVQAQLIDAQGHIWASDEREPCFGFCPTNRWQAGQFVTDYYILTPQATIPAGDYQIVLSIDAPNDTSMDAVIAGSVHIEKNKTSVLASQLTIPQPLYVDMREMRFLGTTDLPTTLHAGETLSLGLYWRARAKPQGDYFAVVQLRDANGYIAFEQAARPANDAYPTTQWNEGEVLLDWHDLGLPTSLRGRYDIWVVLRTQLGDLVGQTRVSPVTVVGAP